RGMAPPDEDVGLVEFLFGHAVLGILQRHRGGDELLVFADDPGDLAVHAFRVVLGDGLVLLFVDVLAPDGNPDRHWTPESPCSHKGPESHPAPIVPKRFRARRDSVHRAGAKRKTGRTGPPATSCAPRADAPSPERRRLRPNARQRTVHLDS